MKHQNESLANQIKQRIEDEDAIPMIAIIIVALGLGLVILTGAIMAFSDKI